MKTKISVAFPSDLYDHIVGLAYGQNTSAAAIIRAAVYAYLCHNPDCEENDWREIWQTAQKTKVVTASSSLRK
ncbi:MAG: hypothetical protein WC505_05825 [Patescibacteria group bacterium]